MKITNAEVKILKELSKVNSEIFFNTTDEIGISNNAKSLIAYWKWDKEISQEFGIGDIPEFLSILSSYKDPELDLSEKFMTIKEGNQKVKYMYTDKANIIVPPDSETLLDVKVKEITQTFSIKKDEIKSIQKQSALLKSPHVVFSGKKVTATDVENSSSNVFSFDITVDNELSSIVIQSDSIQKFIEDDYTIDVGLVEDGDSDTEIFIWKGAENNVTYITIPIDLEYNAA